MLKLKPKVRARLEQVRDHIMANYQQVDMDSWSDNCKLDKAKPVTCGTTACIAGWYALMLPRDERPRKEHDLWKPLAVDLGLMTKAKAAKCPDYWAWVSPGLEEDDKFVGDSDHVDTYASIVHVENWPEHLREIYEQARREGDKLGMAYTAAKRIQLLLDEGN